ncbi:ATP-binding protein [Nocardia sp. NPDC051756]|uniref:ATP-binding protein n=1 Tax=Nocardia sp. NPDC051756 TaxID=3154751 RepID=UPI003427CF27
MEYSASERRVTVNAVTWSPTRGDHLEFDLDAVGLGEVRAAARRLLAGCSGVVIEDAVQVCDELACNALRHAHPARACRLLLIDAARFRVEVDDASPVRPRIRRPDRTGGRGLILVEQLAACWGVDPRGTGKTMWAELGTGACG